MDATSDRPLLGREQEFNRIVAFASGGGCRVQCVIGGCGSGKTSTISRVARRVGGAAAYVGGAGLTPAVFAGQATRPLSPDRPLAIAVDAVIRGRKHKVGASKAVVTNENERLWIIIDEVDVMPQAAKAALKRLVEWCVDLDVARVLLTLVSNDRALPSAVAQRPLHEVDVLTFAAYSDEALKNIGAQVCAESKRCPTDAALTFAARHASNVHAADVRKLRDLCVNATRCAKRSRSDTENNTVSLRDLSAATGYNVTAAGVESSTLLMKQVLACCCSLLRSDPSLIGGVTGSAIISKFHGIVRTLGSTAIPPSHDCLLEALGNLEDMGLLKGGRRDGGAAVLRRFQLAVEPQDLENHLREVAAEWLPVQG